MSFWKKIFGGGAKSGAKDLAKDIPGAKIEYQGFIIRATPYQEGGQFQLCALISKDIDGVHQEHRLVRADRFSLLDDAVRMTHIKARYLIDEQGEQIFK